jgi:hypothetical protein
MTQSQKKFDVAELILTHDGIIEGRRYVSFKMDEPTERSFRNYPKVMWYDGVCVERSSYNSDSFTICYREKNKPVASISTQPKRNGNSLDVQAAQQKAYDTLNAFQMELQKLFGVSTYVCIFDSGNLDTSIRIDIGRK